MIRVPEPPEDLNERERAAWTAHAEQVDALEIFTRSDLSVFAQWARMEALLEAALAGERTEVDAQGNARPPSLGAIATLSRGVAAFAAMFRCTPLSRGAVPATAGPEPAEGDDLDDLRPIGSAPEPKPETH